MGIRVYANDAERLRFAGINDTTQWSFQEVLTGGGFDLAILFHWFWTGISVSEHYIDPVRRFSPRTRVAILTDDQHGVREERIAQVSGLLADYLRAADLRQREQEVYRSADLVLGISEADIQGITARIPDVRTGLLTMTAEIAPVAKAFEQREGLLFVGDFANRTTSDSAGWLLEAIWPKVKKELPEARLYIAGNLSESSIRQTPPGVRVLGHVEDLGDLYQECRVFVAPTRSCTGVQTKILRSLSCGLPAVTTPVAAEGLGLLDSGAALLAGEACEFANQIVRLDRDPVLWNSISTLAQNHVRKEFSQEKLRSQVRDLAAAVAQIEPRRFDPNHIFSVLRVEREFPEAIDNPDPKTRFFFRRMGYLRLGEELLALGKPREAREQFLHIFPYVRGPIPRIEFFARLLINLSRCEELLGQGKDRYLTAAQACLLRPAPGAKPIQLRSSARPGRQPVISVIVPTFNRSAILASCLAAWENQSLEKSEYEVIVVDDSSLDTTEHLCRGLSPGFQFYYYRQKSSGVGAARNLGLNRARGRYVLFVNDDTIATPTLLQEHLRAQGSCAAKKYAVLGDFHYSLMAGRRALTYFLSKRPFLFPQVNLKEGFHQGSAYFITCNLSVAREAVLAAGSFDCRFRVAEDTEFGARMSARGYEVLYWPAARAVHDHLDFRMDDLVRRAGSYGPATLLLLQKHPSLLGDGCGPFGRLDAAWKARTLNFLRESRPQVEEALAAAKRLDDFEFSALLHGKLTGGNSPADEIINLLEKAVNHVYWYYLLEAMMKELAEQEAAGADVELSIATSVEEKRPLCQL
jgi:glycosyltransferase involved in cell wall biosynthesis